MSLSAPPLQQRLQRLAAIVRVRLTVVRARDLVTAPTRRVPWLLLAVVLGLGLRSYHYASNPPVWHDEAAQIYNVLHTDISGLLGTLYYSEACPPLFLALEKGAVWLLGDSTFALRLLPFLASCLAYLALVALARTLLPRSALVWLALLMGCSDRLLWHACEAKPYSVDVLVAAALLALFVRAKDDERGSQRLLVVLAVLAPPLVFLSFPACFLLGGAAAALLPAAWKSRTCRWRYAAFLVSLGVSFVVLYSTAIQAQKNDRIVACWAHRFPPWGEPWRLPLLTSLRILEVFRYAAEPAGNVLAPLAAFGGITLWRAGRGRLLLFLIVPTLLNMAAWLQGSYPLEASRVVLYAAPAALLLVAAGIAPACSWLRRRNRLTLFALMALMLVPVAKSATVFFKPWTRLDSATPVAFVLEHRLPHEPVIGTLWEQEYYCRQLGPMYRALAPQPTEPPSLPATAAVGPDGRPSGAPVRSLWLLTDPDPALQAAHLAHLLPTGAWRVVQRRDFPDVTVLRLSRD